MAGLLLPSPLPLCITANFKQPVQGKQINDVTGGFARWGVVAGDKTGTVAADGKAGAPVGGRILH